jgi:uncharacterized protein
VLTVNRARSRPYSVPATPFEVATEDGILLRGDRLGAGDIAVVFCHGFLGWHRKDRLVPFQEELAGSCSVYAFDFRGHGESRGVSTFGSAEHFDVDAVVRLARREGARRIVTFGGSMGGIAVIRHGAVLGGADLVVAVSTPARWSGHESAAVRRMMWFTTASTGRWMLQQWGVRVPSSWRWSEDPAELVGRIAPTPLVLIHGRDDHYFDEEQAWLLYRRAGQPKRLLLASRFGHAEDGYGPGFARIVLRLIAEGGA